MYVYHGCERTSESAGSVHHCREVLIHHIRGVDEAWNHMYGIPFVGRRPP